MEKEKLSELTMPCKIFFMPHHTFRQNSPAIIGVDVIDGVLKVGMELMKPDCSKIGFVKSIKSEKENMQEAVVGKQVAVGIEGPTVGRQIHENETYYSVISEPEFRKLRDAKDCLDFNTRLRVCSLLL